MHSIHHRSFVVSDRSYGAAIKREVRLLAGALRFSEKKMGELDIIIAELLSNLVKYATEGELLVKPIPDPDNAILELISVDRGPGMKDPGRMLVDGVSTGGSLGQGLGAVQRLATEFQLYSQPGQGTVVLVRLHQKAKTPAGVPPLADVRCIHVPKTGETICGDASYSKLTGASLTVFLGDGLGHGPLANQAVVQAIRTLEQQCETWPRQATRSRS